MKAFTYTQYGTPDALQLNDVPKPIPTANQVLIKIHAVSLNAADLDYLHGTLFIRFGGLQKPAHLIIGSDVAGTVEAVGRNVRRFRVGDAVFGDTSTCGFGAFAEYVCAPESALALKPASISFEQASTLPQAGLLALQAIRDDGKIRPGDKVLINGAGGGVGTFAVQIAKAFGAEVTAVDSAAKLELLHTLGADHRLDYTKTDYTRTNQRYDLIVDVIAKRSLRDYKHALTENGVFSMVGGSNAAILQVFALGKWVSSRGSQKLGVLIWDPSANNLTELAALVETGKVAPVIDRCYPLGELKAALRYLEAWHAKGKVVLTVA